MTVGDWLAQRTPPPPDALAARIRDALGGDLSRDVSNASEACLAAAEQRLTMILSQQHTGRESALDLLAADALITYALERVAESATSVDAWATGAMRRIAALGARHARGAA